MLCCFGEVELVVCLGMMFDLDDRKFYDVVIVGVGFVGLVVVVYGVLEGLLVLVFEEYVVGG